MASAKRTWKRRALHLFVEFFLKNFTSCEKGTCSCQIKSNAVSRVQFVPSNSKVETYGSFLPDQSCVLLANCRSNKSEKRNYRHGYFTKRNFPSACAWISSEHRKVFDTLTHLWSECGVEVIAYVGTIDLKIKRKCVTISFKFLSILSWDVELPLFDTSIIYYALRLI